MPFHEKCFVTVLLFAVFVVCFLVAAVEKLEEILEIDENSRYGSYISYYRPAYVTRATQTDNDIGGVVYSDIGPEAIKSHSGHVYFIDESGCEYGPLSWDEMRAHIADKEVWGGRAFNLCTARRCIMHCCNRESFVSVLYYAIDLTRYAEMILYSDTQCS